MPNSVVHPNTPNTHPQTPHHSKVVHKTVKRKSSKKKIAFLMTLNIISIICLGIILSVYGRVMYYEVRYAIASVFSDEIKNSQKYYNGLPKNVSAGQEILLEPILKIPTPKDRSFTIIIPKINVNKNVVVDVDINDPEQVSKALGSGVGWAKGTVEPGSDGNALLFSHSTRNVWDIVRYSSEFTLLNKLETNDMFSIIYRDRQYDFLVYEKNVVPAGDTSYLTSVADGKIVTLQTCYPAGSDKERLLVRGRLIAMEVK